MKIYLDNCMFNRPFDDQSNFKIRLESEAKLKIQENIRSGVYDLIWSYILDYENDKNPFRERREQIAKWEKYSIENIVEDDLVINLATSMRQHNIKKFDSLHIACAIKGNTDYFLTTDNGILNKSKLIHDLRIIDPIDFIKEVLA